MNTVTLSANFEVLVPADAREALHLVPGEQIQVVTHADRIELIPVRPIQSMRGYLRGMDTTIECEEDRL